MKITHRLTSHSIYLIVLSSSVLFFLHKILEILDLTCHEAVFYGSPPPFYGKLDALNCEMEYEILRILSLKKYVLQLEHQN